MTVAAALALRERSRVIRPMPEEQRSSVDGAVATCSTGRGWAPFACAGWGGKNRVMAEVTQRTFGRAHAGHPDWSRFGSAVAVTQDQLVNPRGRKNPSRVRASLRGPFSPGRPTPRPGTGAAGRTRFPPRRRRCGFLAGGGRTDHRGYRSTWISSIWVKASHQQAIAVWVPTTWSTPTWMRASARRTLVGIRTVDYRDGEGRLFHHETAPAHGLPDFRWRA